MSQSFAPRRGEMFIVPGPPNPAPFGGAELNLINIIQVYSAPPNGA